jgi:hypothetical protein
MHLRRLWKVDFSLATLAKHPHLGFCFVVVANHVVLSENMLLQLIGIFREIYQQYTNFGQKRSILRLEAGACRSGSCHYCHFSRTNGNFPGEKAKGPFTLPLPPRCTLMYRVLLPCLVTTTFNISHAFFM